MGRDGRIMAVGGLMALMGIILAWALFSGAGQSGTTPGERGVRIAFPPDGAIIYAAALTVRGESAGADSFRVELLVDSADELRRIAGATVTTAAGDWSLELPHGYDGDPSEAIIRAVSLDGEREYSRALIALSPLSARPAGMVYTITRPVMGAEVGGDVVQLEGRASGVPDNVLVVTLRDDRSETIERTTVFLENPYYVDDIPFTVDLHTRGYTGPATITVAFGEAPDAPTEVIAVTVSAAAG
ncbi:MAG: hypothetical protein EA396_09140 [Anaerolineaceae bacterium]|nr:MAG: hypothetical protein EA396_09140 [Anaerolineaceae bacterium]